MSEHTDKVLKEMGQSSGFSEHVERTLGWHIEHKRLGFADPIADIYEELSNEKAQLSEENATFDKEAQQTDYISRQAAIDSLGERPMSWTDSDYEIAQRNQYDADLLAIETVPPADVVEVVRCKDCKYRPKSIDGATQGFDVWFAYDSKCPCECDDGWYNWYPKDDWFCADGERRTDE